jgi:hypothetical protein
MTTTKKTTTTKRTTKKATATKAVTKSVTPTVNTKLQYSVLEALVSRIDTLKKCDVADEWIIKNEVISEAMRYHLLASVSLKRAYYYDKLASAIASGTLKIDSKHKVKIDGVKELRVG